MNGTALGEMYNKMYLKRLTEATGKKEKKGLGFCFSFFHNWWKWSEEEAV